MSWPKVALGEICIVDWGNTSLTKSSYVAGGDYLAVSATGGDGRIDHWEHKAMTPVISAIGAQCGKLFLPKEDFTAIKNTITLTPIDDSRNQEACCTIYLYHLLSSMQLPRRGAGQPFISKGDLEKFMIPLPPLEEQRRIAGILDKADSLRERLVRRNGLMDAMIGSMLLNDFGSQAEWPSNWEMQKLGDCCECLDRYRKPIKESERKKGDIPYYGANGQQGWIDDFLFDESLVLVAEDGGHFSDRKRGVAYRIDGKSWVNNHAHILRPRPESLEVEFLHRILRHYDFVPYISGSTRSKLTQGQLNEVSIPVPPIESQRRFVDRAAKVVSGIERSARSLDAAYSLMDSLRSHYLESKG